uniref:Uncharacterized protein n=1 Tax=Anguilla anguilla TaxID=7936 RepID=A0A0E9RWQ2_ANGAN
MTLRTVLQFDFEYSYAACPQVQFYNCFIAESLFWNIHGLSFFHKLTWQLVSQNKV